MTSEKCGGDPFTNCMRGGSNITSARVWIMGPYPHPSHYIKHASPMTPTCLILPQKLPGMLYSALLFGGETTVPTQSPACCLHQ